MLGGKNMTTSWMRAAPYAILFVIILLGIILLPLPTLLMTAGGLSLPEASCC